MVHDDAFHACGLGDRIDDLIRQRIGDDNFQTLLGHEVHGIFRAAIDFGVPGLRAEALDLGYHHAAHPDGGQRFADLLQLERLDCCNDEFHVVPLPLAGARLDPCPP